MGKIKSTSSDYRIQEAIQELYDDNDGKVSLNEFLQNKELGVAYPEFKISYKTPLGKNSDYSNIEYQLVIDGAEENHALSDNRFKITSIGVYNEISLELPKTK